MATPLTSLVIPSRGGAERLPDLLKALRQQTVSDWEAIVVLDGDVDDSLSTLEEHSVDLPVSWIVFEENRGRSSALNAGFGAAVGDVLVRCDDDLVPAPTYVADHARAHRGRTVGVVGLYRNVYPDTTYARVYGRDWDEQFRRDAYAGPSGQAWRYWAGNASVTRDVWQQVGPYDTAFRSYGWEDVDWGYRAHRLGVPITLEPALETEHRIAATTTASRAQRAYYAGAARNRFETKHAIDPPSHQAASPWNVVVQLLASQLDEARVATMGRAVDRIAVRCPRPLAKKAVALAVEAASLAGHDAGAAGSAI